MQSAHVYECQLTMAPLNGMPDESSSPNRHMQTQDDCSNCIESKTRCLDEAEGQRSGFYDTNCRKVVEPFWTMSVASNSYLMSVSVWLLAGSLLLGERTRHVYSKCKWTTTMFSILFAYSINARNTRAGRRCQAGGPEWGVGYHTKWNCWLN